MLELLRLELEAAADRLRPQRGACAGGRDGVDQVGQQDAGVRPTTSAPATMSPTLRPCRLNSGMTPKIPIQIVMQSAQAGIAGHVGHEQDRQRQEHLHLAQQVAHHHRVGRNGPPARSITLRPISRLPGVRPRHSSSKNEK